MTKGLLSFRVDYYPYLTHARQWGNCLYPERVHQVLNRLRVLNDQELALLMRLNADRSMPQGAQLN